MLAWEKHRPLLYGATTNPLILQRDGVPCTLESVARLAQAARRLQLHELQVQAWGESAAALEATACRVLDVNPALLTIKLPCTAHGLSAASALAARDPGVRITITGVYAPHQVLAAQAVGADYVAPYLGRMADAAAALDLAASVARPRAQLPDDADLEQLYARAARMQAEDAVLAMQAMLAASGSSMRVLVASVRTAQQLAVLAAGGCDTFTLSPAVMAVSLDIGHLQIQQRMSCS